MMEVERTAIEGVLVLRPKVFQDPRGYFLESFNQEEFTRATGSQTVFVQDNESGSAKGVLRGLHLQVGEHAQAKLVRVTAGAVLDVCVDLRPGSATFGKHVPIRLDARGKTMFFIPPGLAHGFLALEEDTVFLYKCSAPYAPQAERTILWNDPDLAIDWGIADPLVSAKDQAGQPFSARHWTL
jgi:dTDP-4-dehydrorhamnose 3,5-epimerase